MAIMTPDIGMVQLSIKAMPVMMRGNSSVSCDLIILVSSINSPKVN